MIDDGTETERSNKTATFYQLFQNLSNTMAHNIKLVSGFETKITKSLPSDWSDLEFVDFYLIICEPFFYH